ncbi:DNA topoisomerase III [Thalassotalea aquiviva]|uniref:DNA topoisomerase III n=1 Tax=Thalassotalea aquiviva TaxID=3242415 RepID=UPI00352A60C7
MKLYIAEKPSLGRAIANALPKPHKNHKTYIEVGNGDVVSWCIGHILEQAEPQDYDQKYAKWQLEHLPIVPETWQLKPKYQTRSQLSTLKKLVKQASLIVHAGDPDREGQLLVDEVIDYLNVSATKKNKIQRLLISDLNISAVKKALNSMQPNKDFVPLSVSALARARADWLYGLNMTRAYTILGKKSGFEGVLSVGRVQTPVLGLVVQRDLDIEQFVSKPFYQVLATLATQDGQVFHAKWQPSQACAPYMDEEGRVVVKKLAENVVARITHQPATVADVRENLKKQNPPLPYNLSALQIDAAKRFHLSAKIVLDGCQSLYEKHKLITYPRSDCRYLPKDQWAQSSAIIDMLASGDPSYAESAKKADKSLKSKAWNDAKVGAHHAIVPTLKSAKNISLSSTEQRIYQLIIRQYLAQFYPPHQYAQTDVLINIVEGEFKASAKVVKVIGWKALFQHSGSKDSKSSEAKEDNSINKTLPPLVKGQGLQSLEPQLLEKQTKPPASFTDASLLAAMTGIARFVQAAEIKSILRETDGLGTEATRAGIIELLFKRGYLERQHKHIRATDIGRKLIQALPLSARLPDMTAQWEASLNNIAERQTSYQQFMQPLTQTLTQLMGFATENPPTQFQGLKAPGKPAYRKRRRRAGAKAVKKAS